jgi:hypothetical protein
VLAAAAQRPFIVRIVETPEPGLREIMLNALGLSGVLAVGAVLVGILVAAVIIWMRSRSVVTRSDITRPNSPS